MSTDSNNVTSGTIDQNNNHNDPLYLANSDHPGMLLTTAKFNGNNFIGWRRTIVMALGAKFKLGFIDGSCLRPPDNNTSLQRWIRCDYMVACWILNSMEAEITEGFLYAQSACNLWNEINERYGQSNGPLIYQIENELAKLTQGNSSVATFFNKLKRFWDELQSLIGHPVCHCGTMAACTCNLVQRYLEIDNRTKLIQFLMKLNDSFESVRSNILSMDPLPNVNRAYYLVQQVEKQKEITVSQTESAGFFACLNSGPVSTV